MKKKSVILVLILFIITAATACIYLLGRDEPSEGCLTVLCGGNSKTVDPFSKGLQPVSGVLINGKGEEKEISGSGVPLKDVITLSGIKEGAYQSAKIVSSDEYAAELTADEIKEDGKAFLIKDTSDDNSMTIRLIVFGDSNSKRQVKNVERIELS